VFLRPIIEGFGGGDSPFSRTVSSEQGTFREKAFHIHEVSEGGGRQRVVLEKPKERKVSEIKRVIDPWTE